MKNKLSLTLVGILLSVSLFGQYDIKYDKKLSEEYVNRSPIYLDISSGLDNHTGVLGVAALVPVAEIVGLRAGLGIGAWGPKYSLGFKLEQFTKDGWGFGMGYSHCPGFEDIDLTFSTSSGDHLVNLDFLTTGSINLTFNRNWIAWEKHILFIESGYAVKTGTAPIYQVNDGGPLNEEEEWILEILRPGGIIFTLGIQFGL